MSDGITAAVRLDEAKVRPKPKGFVDEVAHAHKEIVPTSEVKNGNYDVKATSLDDSGNILGSSQADKRPAHIPTG